MKKQLNTNQVPRVPQATANTAEVKLYDFTLQFPLKAVETACVQIITTTQTYVPLEAYVKVLIAQEAGKQYAQTLNSEPNPKWVYRSELNLTKDGLGIDYIAVKGSIFEHNDG